MQRIMQSRLNQVVIKRQGGRAGFTIMELMVAMTLMMILVTISGVVFRSAVKTYRTASATAEILRKYQAITSQLNADFSGLRKESEIFAAWVPGVDTTGDQVVDEFNRFDRILFFSTGATNFDTYHLWPELPPLGAGIDDVENVIIRNNTARICYMLAKDGQGNPAQSQEPRTRVLARSQHIYTPQYICEINPATDQPFNPLLQSVFPNPNTFNADQNNYYEYDTITDAAWLSIPYTGAAGCPKSIMLEQITDISIVSGNQQNRGLQYDESDPATHHLVLSQGVGQFAIQGWSDQLQRWVPELDPNGDGNLADTDFIPNGVGVDAEEVPGIIYPQKLYSIGPGVPDDPDDDIIREVNDMIQANFNNIPGFGRAFKFTFTLYDSKQIFPEGKTFTHIVYLN